jgi:hypothetical protein
MPLAGRVDRYVSSTSTRIFPRPRRISTFLYCFLKWWIPATGSTFLGLAANCLQPLATGHWPLVRHCDHPLSPLSSTVNNTRQCPSLSCLDTRAILFQQASPQPSPGLSQHSQECGSYCSPAFFYGKMNSLNIVKAFILQLSDAGGRLDQPRLDLQTRLAKLSYSILASMLR